MSKKKKKLDLMSEEERLLYMQQKMLDEEETQRRKEEMLSQFLKDKLSKEQHSTRINVLKLTEKWRNVMREAKAADLRKDIEILSQTFGRIVDRKDGIIRALTKDLEEAEQQYLTTMRSHVQNIDKLMDLQRSRLVVLEDELKAEVELLTEELNVERQQMMAKHEPEIDKVENILHGIDLVFTTISGTTCEEFINIKEDLINKGLEKKFSLRVHLESLVEDLWVKFQLGLKDYVDATEDRKIAFEALKARDEKNSKEIEIQMKKAQKIQDTITALKMKTMVSTWKHETNHSRIREAKNVIKKYFLMQKNQMNSLRAYEREQLVKLTVESEAAIEALKNICAKGENILKMAEACRKLETEREKVLPFYSCSLTPEEEEKVQTLMKKPPCQELTQMMTDFEALEQFWKRYNKVRLDQVVLEQDKRTLLQENQKLRQLLKQYLDGVSVSDQILSDVNPLIVINNKTNVKSNMPVTVPAKLAYNIIETVYVVNHAV